MSDLLNYIEQHAGSALALSKAAEYLSVSPSHLSKTFKARTGVRFVDYVAEKRIERAKLMLAHTDLPVLRIATDLSFQPVNYFSRVFKKHTAMTPSDYRRWCTTPDAQENTA